MNKIILITGATSGFGKATAELLARDGFPLLLMGRRVHLLRDLVHKLVSENTVDVQAWSVDVRDREALEKNISQNQHLLKDLGVIVNNAGLARGVTSFQEGELSDWDDVIATNVTGVLNVTRLFLPFLLEQKQGYIVNIGSVAGRWVYPGGTIYNASKFALRAINDGLRMDLLGKNIRVTNIEPGMVNTEFSLVRLGDEKKAESVYEGMTPLQANDIAETISWCLQRPPHVNIQELVIYPTAQASPYHVFRE